ncbi:MAG: hypothetical protein AAGG02_18905 [Cyanobacteria bacterium P01_H01_bin.15]
MDLGYFSHLPHTYLMHYRQIKSFEGRGINVDHIVDVVFQTSLKDKRVGPQRRSRGIYELQVDGKKEYISITVGSNGFIVGASPSKSSKIKQLKERGVID